MKFKVGDRVRVIEEPPEIKSIWVPGMGKTCGRYYVILLVNSSYNGRLIYKLDNKSAFTDYWYEENWIRKSPPNYFKKR